MPVVLVHFHYDNIFLVALFLHMLCKEETLIFQIYYVVFSEVKQDDIILLEVKFCIL